MKRWLGIVSAQFKRLWFQLAVSYTLLAFFGLNLLIAMLYGLDDYSDFRSAITLANVEERIASEKLTVAQVIRDPANAAWRDKARDAIREKLVNMERGSRTSIYRITSSSRPEAYIQVRDRNGRIVMADPAVFPQSVAARFAGSPPPPAEGSVGRQDGPIRVDMPIADDNGRAIGHLQVLFIAKFDPWVELQSIFGFLFFAWDSLFLCSVPIGIACGLVASRYVTKHLKKMNDVTERWRQGDFAPRIELPNDDVLIRHSQYLNDMAQDLEMYLSLKQNLAVTDERNRVARELHDTVKQKLFALGLQLATAKAKPAGSEGAQEHICEAEAITREAQRDLMEVITQLRPAGTGDVSFYERLGMIVEDFRRRFKVHVELSHSGSAQFSALAEHHVLRIVQEALMNAVRHGKASKIVIENEIDRDTAKLMITDDGCGFDIAKKTGGFGITSMRDRVHDLPAGTFDIESAVEGGTKLTLSWKNES